MKKILSSPLSLVLLVTEKCNLNCKHCYNRTDNYYNELSTEEMLDLIDQLGKMKVLKLSISGGEPLLRKDLFKIIEEIKKNNIFIDQLNTNATLITEDIAKDLVKKFKINLICVSLDGDKKVHDYIRGKGNFDLTIEGTKKLVKEGGNVFFSVSIGKLNFNEVEKIVFIGRHIGVKFVRFNHLYHSGNSLCYIKEHNMTLEEEKYVCATIDKLSKKYKKFIMGSFLIRYRQFKEADKVIPKSKHLVTLCDAGVKICAIRPDGEVIPCEILWNIKCGNIRKKKFIDIWKNSKMLKKFREPLNIDLSRTDCANCKYQMICFHGHRCWPYFYNGGIKNKNLYCLKSN